MNKPSAVSDTPVTSRCRRLTPEFLQHHTCGRWLHRRGDEHDRLRGVGIDSRDDLTGRAFFAIRGERHDGHDFIEEAIENRASIIVLDHVQRNHTFPQNVAVLQVENTRAALGQSATAYRRLLTGTPVIAVTGSCGKTTTKQLIHAILSRTLAGTVALRSFNNDIGVPLTMLAASPNDQYLLLEIGTNSPGEIDALGAIAQPDIAVITNYGRAHLEGFGSVEAIAAEKNSLLKHLQPQGTGVLPADGVSSQSVNENENPGYAFLSASMENTSADLRLTNRKVTGNGQEIEVNEKESFALPLPGRHNALNALAAIAVADVMGVSLETIRAGLSAAEAPEMRLARVEIDGVTFYNDAYNANPEAMTAALETFAEITPESTRRIVILGDMLELGSDGPHLHRVLGDQLIELDRRTSINHAVFVGTLAREAAETVKHKWGDCRVSSHDELTDESIHAILARLQPGDAVMIKASRRIGLEHIINEIRHGGPQKATEES